MQPGYRGKTFVRDGLEIWRGELTEVFANDGCWTEKKVFVFHVLEGEALVRFKDGRVIPVREGDSGIIPPGDAGAHTLEVPTGEHCVIVGFASV